MGFNLGFKGLICPAAVKDKEAKAKLKGP